MDHYRDDGKPFSTRNVLMTVFLILIMVLVFMDVWLTPQSHVIDFEQDEVIPWSPHPPVP